MPEENATQQTAMAEGLAGSAPVTESAEIEGSAPETPVEDSQITEDIGAAPAEEPRVKLSELTTTRKRAQAAEARAAAAEAQLAQQATPQQQPEASGDPAEPKVDHFETYEEYLDARMDYRENKKRENEIASKVNVNFNSKLFEAEKTNPGISDKINQGFYPTDPLKLGAIKEAGPEVAAYLADNPNESVKLHSMPVSSALREIGKIEARLMKPTTQAQPPKITQAPEPITPLGGSTGAGVMKDPSKMTQAEWNAFMEKRGAR